ncbi:MAG TPA: energy transducer TonB, partial [Blastocatellia bacterium]|nr:energy transducer TonB [Blastocatellia bacterium]
GSAVVSAQSPTRLAIVDLVGDESKELSSLLRGLAKASTNAFELSDEDLIRLASRGAGYAGSLNLSRDEARALGQSIGCDFYVLGKVQTARRLAPGEQFYFDALAGLFFVESRSGKLIQFIYERAKAQQERQAMEQLKDNLKQNWPRYAAAIAAARKLQAAAIESVGQPSPPPVEVLTDDLAAGGVLQPFFYQRIKPEYTEQADLAGIVATVELEAVFREDGTIGEIEIVRWAGFGLDESAVATVKKLRFKPALRGEKPLTIIGLVRYNFRRPLSQAERQEEIERLKRSLQNIKQVPTQTSGRPKP